MSAPMMGWIDYESPSLGTAYMFGGFCNYLIGFYDWYQGRTMLSFVDFIFGLLHLTFYYTADLGKYSIWVLMNIIHICKESFIFYGLQYLLLLSFHSKIKDEFILYIFFYLPLLVHFL